MVDLILPQTGEDDDAWGPILNAALTALNDGKVSKGELVINVRDYGAVGNGVANDTTAVAAAITAAAVTGAVVYLPAGEYDTSTLTLTASLRGDGRATTILNAGTITIGADDIEVAGIAVVAKTATAISAANHADLTLRDVDISHGTGLTGHLGVDAYQITRFKVLGCRMHIGGVQLSGCVDFLLEGNYFDCAYANTNEPMHVSAQSSGVVAFNTVTQTLTDGLDLYSSGEYCVVTGNRFYGLKGASGIEVKVTMSDDSGNTSGPGNVIDGVVISNNILRDFIPPATGTRMGIYAEYLDFRAVPVFATAETNRALIITGNVIEDMNAADPGGSIIGSYWGVSFTGHNGLVTNNIVRNVRAWHGAAPVGICVAYEAGTKKSVGVRVAGNVVAGIEGGPGIQVGSLDHCQVDGNIVRGDEVNGTETKYGVYIRAGGALVGCSISGNTFQCNSATGFGIRGVDTTSTLTQCRVHSNTFKDCGLFVPVAQRTSFALNVMENPTNSQNFGVGTAGTSCRGNTYHGNHILMSSDYGLVLADHDGFVVSGSSFRDTTRGVLLTGGTRKGIVTGNLSINQTGGTEMPHYSGVSAPDQATMVVANNLVTT